MSDPHHAPIDAPFDVPRDFTLDGDDLLDVIAAMSRCEGSLRALADDLTRRVTALHETWQGEAAAAQAAAQQEWESGFRAMREALAAIRAAADVAHANYTRAATANLELWGQLR